MTETRTYWFNDTENGEVSFEDKTSLLGKKNTLVVTPDSSRPVADDILNRILVAGGKEFKKAGKGYSCELSDEEDKKQEEKSKLAKKLFENNVAVKGYVYDGDKAVLVDKDIVNAVDAVQKAFASADKDALIAKYNEPVSGISDKEKIAEERRNKLLRLILSGEYSAKDIEELLKDDKYSVLDGFVKEQMRALAAENYAVKAAYGKAVEGLWKDFKAEEVDGLASDAEKEEAKNKFRNFTAKNLADNEDLLKACENYYESKTPENEAKYKDAKKELFAKIAAASADELTAFENDFIINGLGLPTFTDEHSISVEDYEEDSRKRELKPSHEYIDWEKEGTYYHFETQNNYMESKASELTEEGKLTPYPYKFFDKDGGEHYFAPVSTEKGKNEGLGSEFDGLKVSFRSDYNPDRNRPEDNYLFSSGGYFNGSEYVSRKVQVHAPDFDFGMALTIIGKEVRENDVTNFNLNVKNKEHVKLYLQAIAALNAQGYGNGEITYNIDPAIRDALEAENFFEEVINPITRKNAEKKEELRRAERDLYEAHDKDRGGPLPPPHSDEEEDEAARKAAEAAREAAEKLAKAKEVLAAAKADDFVKTYRDLTEKLGLDPKDDETKAALLAALLDGKTDGFADKDALDAYITGKDDLKDAKGFLKDKEISDKVDAIADDLAAKAAEEKAKEEETARKAEEERNIAAGMNQLFGENGLADQLEEEGKREAEAARKAEEERNIAAGMNQLFGENGLVDQLEEEGRREAEAARKAEEERNIAAGMNQLFGKNGLADQLEEEGRREAEAARAEAEKAKAEAKAARIAAEDKRFSDNLNLYGEDVAAMFDDLDRKIAREKQIKEIISDLEKRNISTKDFKALEEQLEGRDDINKDAILLIALSDNQEALDFALEEGLDNFLANENGKEAYDVAADFIGEPAVKAAFDEALADVQKRVADEEAARAEAEKAKAEAKAARIAAEDKRFSDNLNLYGEDVAAMFASLDPEQIPTPPAPEPAPEPTIIRKRGTGKDALRAARTSGKNVSKEERDAIKNAPSKDITAVSKGLQGLLEDDDRIKPMLTKAELNKLREDKDFDPAVLVVIFNTNDPDKAKKAKDKMLNDGIGAFKKADRGAYNKAKTRYENPAVQESINAIVAKIDASEDVARIKPAPENTEDDRQAQIKEIISDLEKRNISTKDFKALEEQLEGRDDINKDAILLIALSDNQEALDFALEEGLDNFLANENGKEAYDVAADFIGEPAVKAAFDEALADVQKRVADEEATAKKIAEAARVANAVAAEAAKRDAIIKGLENTDITPDEFNSVQEKLNAKNGIDKKAVLLIALSDREVLSEILKEGDSGLDNFLKSSRYEDAKKLIQEPKVEAAYQKSLQKIIAERKAAEKDDLKEEFLKGLRETKVSAGELSALYSVASERKDLDTNSVVLSGLADKDLLQILLSENGLEEYLNGTEAYPVAQDLLKDKDVSNAYNDKLLAILKEAESEKEKADLVKDKTKLLADGVNSISSKEFNDIRTEVQQAAVLSNAEINVNKVMFLVVSDSKFREGLIRASEEGRVEEYLKSESAKIEQNGEVLENHDENTEVWDAYGEIFNALMSGNVEAIEAATEKANAAAANAEEAANKLAEERAKAEELLKKLEEANKEPKSEEPENDSSDVDETEDDGKSKSEGDNETEDEGKSGTGEETGKESESEVDDKAEEEGKSETEEETGKESDSEEPGKDSASNAAEQAEDAARKAEEERIAAEKAAAEAKATADAIAAAFAQFEEISTVKKTVKEAKFDSTNSSAINGFFGSRNRFVQESIGASEEDIVIKLSGVFDKICGENGENLLFDKEEDIFKAGAFPEEFRKLVYGYTNEDGEHVKGYIDEFKENLHELMSQTTTVVDHRIVTSLALRKTGSWDDLVSQAAENAGVKLVAGDGPTTRIREAEKAYYHSLMNPNPKKIDQVNVDSSSEVGTKRSLTGKLKFMCGAMSRAAESCPELQAEFGDLEALQATVSKSVNDYITRNAGEGYELMSKEAELMCYVSTQKDDTADKIAENITKMLVAEKKTLGK